jgi:hypothetical protein
MGMWQFWSTAFLAAVIFAALIVSGRKPARTIKYRLDGNGVTIDGALTPYNTLQSFGVYHDGKVWTVSLTPQRRLSLAITIIVPDDKGEAIIDILGEHLPMNDAKPDLADRFSRRFNI